MTGRPLERSSGSGRPERPVRMLHLGLGNFFRSHQAWYTDRSRDADGWGYAAFAGRSARLAELLQSQDGLYTLVTRAPEGDRVEVVASLSACHPADDDEAWLSYWRSKSVVVVTMTITEAGYLRGPDGGVDGGSTELTSDIEALRGGATARFATGPGRIVAGLAARRAADAGPIALVPCDNLPANGRVMEQVLGAVAERVDAALRSWMEESVAYVTTVVDRITPAVTADEALQLARITGWNDLCPVVTEPFSEWVMSGSFPGGRPLWESAGAELTDDVEPYERRKLWLLNGAHSLLAYIGSIRGHTTVPEAIADPTCREWVEQWWAEASPHIPLPDGQVTDYRTQLLRRFSNARMADRLARIAEDGSAKIPVRVIPVVRAEREAGRLPLAAARILAGWICHLRGLGAPVRDAGAGRVQHLAQGALPDAVPRVLEWLDPRCRSDDELVEAVIAETIRISSDSGAARIRNRSAPGSPRR